jgi:hypothetical protein
MTSLVVFGPDNVPAINHPEEAANDLMLAVFSAPTHSRRPVVGGILEALATALTTIDEKPPRTWRSSRRPGSAIRSAWRYGRA